MSGSDTHRDHILIDLFAEADASVIALRDDVGDPVVGFDLGGDVGIAHPQPPHSRPKDRLGGVITCHQAESAGGLLT